MNVMVGIAAFRELSFCSSLMKEAAKFAVEFSERYFDGPQGLWIFTEKPVKISPPGPGGLNAWADEWMTLGSGTEAARGEKRSNGLARLKSQGRLFRGDSALAPALDEIIQSSAGLAGHTVAVLLLNGPPADGAAFVRTMKKASRYPVFWVFIGTKWGEVCHLGVVDTLGERPGDPENFVILKTDNWSELTKWATTRRIRRAVARWQKQTPTG